MNEGTIQAADTIVQMPLFDSLFGIGASAAGALAAKLSKAADIPLLSVDGGRGRLPLDLELSPIEPA
jgi:hypothetical protein